MSVSKVKQPVIGRRDARIDTSKVDSRKRIVVPQLKPGTSVGIFEQDDGTILLVRVKPPESKRPFDPHLYDDLVGERLAEQQALEAASAKVDVGSEEWDRE